MDKPFSMAVRRRRGRRNAMQASSEIDRNGWRDRTENEESDSIGNISRFDLWGMLGDGR